MAKDPAQVRKPRDVAEGRVLLSERFDVPPSELAELFGIDEKTLDRFIQEGINNSSSAHGFVMYMLAGVLPRMSGKSMPRDMDMETILSSIRRIINEEAEELGYVARREVTRVANPTPADLTALSREVSGLDAKVNILLGLAGTLLVGLIAGGITLWQAIGGVETRLTRELWPGRNPHHPTDCRCTQRGW